MNISLSENIQWYISNGKVWLASFFSIDIHHNVAVPLLKIVQCENKNKRID